jgi:hypothetical protein
LFMLNDFISTHDAERSQELLFRQLNAICKHFN